MTPIVSRQTAEHYKWGGPHGDDCDGWHLVRTPNLSIIEELMPPNTSEVRHFHVHSRQFFYVLEGELTLEVERQSFVLQTGEASKYLPANRIKSSTAARTGLAFSSPANLPVMATE